MCSSASELDWYDELWMFQETGPDTGSWTQITTSNSPPARADPAIFHINGRLLVWGGTKENTDNNPHAGPFWSLDTEASPPFDWSDSEFSIADSAFEPIGLQSTQLTIIPGQDALTMLAGQTGPPYAPETTPVRTMYKFYASSLLPPIPVDLNDPDVTSGNGYALNLDSAWIGDFAQQVRSWL